MSWVSFGSPFPPPHLCLFSGILLKPESAASVVLLSLCSLWKFRSKENWKLVGKSTYQKVIAFPLAGFGFLDHGRVHLASAQLAEV